MADPLKLGTIHLEKDDIPKLTSGSKVIEKLQRLAEERKQVTEQIYAEPEILDLFGKVFPEIVESNDIGKVHAAKNRGIWDKDGNIIEIEVDESPLPPSEEAKKNVYIGGPAALFAAFMEAKSRQETKKVDPDAEKNRPQLAYYHNGSRGLSNWKGSASYFHVRDSVPVFYWPDNTGPYVVFNTLRHGMKKTFTPEKYYSEVYGDPDFNMLRISYKGLFRELDSIPLFLKNAMHMMKDVGFYLTPTFRLMPPINSDAKESIAYVSLQHAALTRGIMDRYGSCASKPLILNSSELTRALHLELTPGEKGKHSFMQLKRYNDKYVPFRELPQEEREARGYSDAVLQALEFPVDGYLPPYLGEALEEEINNSRGIVSGKKKMRKMLVRSKDDRDLVVSHVVLEDSETGEVEKVAINELFVSLGPSARNVVVKAPDYSLWRHLGDTLIGFANKEYYDKLASKVYKPTFSSLLRHAVNDIENWISSNNILPKMIWASGSTSVLLIKVDPTKVSEDKLSKFRDHLDKHNRHFVRLGERRVVTEDGKEMVFFATQVVGGGAFPSLNVHPETALNAIKGNAVAIYGLENDGIEYDIVQVRSCARGVTAQNAFRFTAPFANAVQIYGIGGIGITTLAPNALMMKALMKTRKLFAAGKIGEKEYYRRLHCGDFGDIPDFGANIFDRNYAQFVDHAKYPMKLPTTIRRKLGLEDSLSATEYGAVIGVTAVGIASATLLGRRISRIPIRSVIRGLVSPKPTLQLNPNLSFSGLLNSNVRKVKN